VRDWGHQNGTDRPCSDPDSGANLARGSEDKEHAMSQQANCAIAVIGADIGKSSFHVCP
jgi:hypothetical protein